MTSVKAPKLDSPFIHQSILKEAEFNENQQHTFSGDNFTIRVHANDKPHLPTCILSGITKLFNVTVDFSVWPTKKRKKFINSKIGPQDVNSGSTNGETISIWRAEECTKVMVHEVIHCSDLHFNHQSDDLVGNYIRKQYGIQGKVSSVEAFTEWLAILLHSSAVSQKLTNGTNNLTSSLLYNEYLFSLVQCSKLLRHYGCNSLDDLVSKKQVWDQKTDAFSYFIVKTALLSESNYWFETAKNKNFPWYECKDKKIFLGWVQHALRKDGKFLQDLDKVLSTDLGKSWTLRMSCAELKRFLN